MLQDSLRESWTYQKVLEEGRAEGRAEGRIEEVHRTIALFAEKRFPAMLAWAQEQAEQVVDPQILWDIASALIIADTEEEVRQAFAHRESREALQ